MFALLTPNAFFSEAMSHLLIAFICGGIVGLDRQLRGKPVGLRPCMIVVLTTTLLVDIGNVATEGAGDPSRMMSAIVTGVGFLGGGVILSHGGEVRGITTAALIWALAAVGIVIGLGFGLTALAFTLIIKAMMLSVDLIEYLFPDLRRRSQPERD